MNKSETGTCIQVFDVLSIGFGNDFISVDQRWEYTTDLQSEDRIQTPYVKDGENRTKKMYGLEK